MGITTWLKNLGNNTLYYPGCLTKGVLKEQLENYKEIFNILGIDFIMLPDKEVCCGSPVLNAGYKKDARELAKKNFDLFTKYGIKKIITNCPSCYHTFHDLYPKLLREWNIEVEHATVSILNALKNQNIKVPGVFEVVTYHDPCHLGRCSGIYSEPREVIQRLGGKIIEMKHNRESALCCGAGAGVRANFPELAKEAARNRVKEIPEGVNKIISPCGLCFSNLKSAEKQEQEASLQEIMNNKLFKSEEFSSFVLRRLKEAKR